MGAHGAGWKSSSKVRRSMADKEETTANGVQPWLKTRALMSAFPLQGGPLAKLLDL